MDFESMVSSRVWPVRRRAIAHNDLEHPAPPLFYHQDFTKTDRIFRRQVHTTGGDTTDFKDTEQAKNKDLEDAALWPGFSAKKGCMAPFVVSGLAMFWLIPSYVPAFGMGETFLAAYAAGGLTYYMKYAGGPQIKNS
jgi:hypothetical protein